MAQINYLPVCSPCCVGRWGLFTCVNKIQLPSISMLKVPWASMLHQEVETQGSAVKNLHSSAPHGVSILISQWRKHHRVLPAFPSPHEDHSHRGQGGRAADPLPPVKFRDSEESSRQLERNVEETWVRPDTHGITLRVEGVKPGIPEALSRKGKKGSY